MKVGFIAPQSIAAVNGGVRTQATMTSKELTKLGVDVHFVSPWDKLEDLDTDLFHVFSASIENIGIVNRLKESGKKMVLSPVMFSNRSPDFIRRLISWETKLVQFSAGVRSEFAIKKEICELTDLLLPNTNSEKDLIKSAFEIPHTKFNVIPNGVELRFTKSKPDLFIQETGLRDFILFAGQASAQRKNILSLLKAVKDLNTDVVIIGDFDHSDYSRQCLDLASQNSRVHLFETQDHDSEFLSSAYAACHTFVLPSQFETPGIAAMEAALAGSNIVITEAGGTKDYFVDYVEYVDPKSISSIKKGLEASLNKQKNDDLKEHISTNYSWESVAKQTLKAYEEVLK